MVSVKKNLGKKRQIYLPKIFTDQFGLEPGDNVFITLQTDGILISKRPNIDNIKEYLTELSEKRKKQGIVANLGDLKGVSLEDEFED